MNFILGAVVTGAVVLIFRGPGERRYEPFDAWGAATLLVGYPLLLVGFTFGESFGWASLPVLIAFGGALLALSGFVWIRASPRAIH